LLNSQLQQIKDNHNSYKKPHLTFTQQIELLESKGLNIPNPTYAKKKLSCINYYRLSAYFLPFQYPKNNAKADIFYAGTEFREIVSLYDFDAKLRRLVFGVLEVIEVYSDEEFVAHFKDKYNTTDLPLWSVVETLSFTTTSRLFSAMKAKDKKIIADKLGINQKVLSNWLHALTILRNICAHHSRLYKNKI